MSADLEHLVDRTGWLIRLRWLATAGVLAAVPLATALGIAQRPWPLLAVAAGMVALNALWTLQWRRVGLRFEQRVQRRWLTFQIGGDLAALALLLHWSDWRFNPFAAFFAFHVAIAAMILSRRVAAGVAVLSTALYAAVLAVDWRPGVELEAAWIAVASTGAATASALAPGALVAGHLVAFAMTMLGVHAFVFSVAERQRLAEARQRESERLALSRERLAHVGEVSSGVAHALRNPLHGIIGCIDLLRQQIDVHADADATLSLMLEAAQRIERTTNRLLQLKREGPLELRAVDLDSLVIDALRIVSPRARSSAARLVTRPGKAGVVELDADRAAEAIVNVVDNAVDACRAGGEVEVRTGRIDGAWCWIEVQDSGAGISADQLERVFDPFFTTKAIGEGTGLGLSITRRVLEEHGGRVRIQSTPGQGTVVQLLFPAGPPQAQAATKAD